MCFSNDDTLDTSTINEPQGIGREFKGSGRTYARRQLDWIAGIEQD